MKGQEKFVKMIEKEKKMAIAIPSCVNQCCYKRCQNNGKLITTKLFALALNDEMCHYNVRFVVR